MKIVLTKFVKEATDTKLTTPDAVYKAFEEIHSEKNEHFAVAFLNNNNQVISIDVLFIGGISSSIVDPRIIFAEALKYGATSIVLCHNHPAGTLTPSSEDIRITRQLVEAGHIMNIKVIDHVIVTNSEYLSIREVGLVSF
jgi:DNA repair protein RadC